MAAWHSRSYYIVGSPGNGSARQMPSQLKMETVWVYWVSMWGRVSFDVRVDGWWPNVTLQWGCCFSLGFSDFDACHIRDELVFWKLMLLIVAGTVIDNGRGVKSSCLQDGQHKSSRSLSGC